jgi:ribonuclease-3
MTNIPAPREVLTDLESRIPWVFRDRSWFVRMSVHPGAARPGQRLERRQALDFERLEFLGDRILGLAVAQLLYHHYPDAAEGMLAQRLTRLVCRDFLAHVARQLHLPLCVRFPDNLPDGPGDSMLADACEALIGALYMDGGMDAVSALTGRWWMAALETPPHTLKDARTRLQEWTQGRQLGLPAYTDQDGPPEGAPGLFHCTVTIPSWPLQATGSGPSKKQARLQAAQHALALIARHPKEGT